MLSRDMVSPFLVDASSLIAVFGLLVNDINALTQAANP
jgi:hypothetical protein